MMSDDFTAPSPGLAHAFDMWIDFGEPIEVGLIATGGRRRVLPVIGGTFKSCEPSGKSCEPSGKGGELSGTLVAGSEILLERADGVTAVEASYCIAFTNGATARAFGNGYDTGGTKDAGFNGIRLMLLFEAADNGPVMALASRAFIAERPQGSPVTTIARIT